jgi:hypothetical protein
LLFIGELPKKFYIILNGGVNVMLPKSEEEIKKESDELAFKNLNRKRNAIQKFNIKTTFENEG